MKEVRVRKIPDEDYEWVKQQAMEEGMMLETWLRIHFRDLRTGLATTPVKARWVRVPGNNYETLEVEGIK